jgi:3-deoxy-D-manno-octulosonic-acid transferase
VLVIDNVGMLSRLYKYAAITYVGGGFTRDGIHNILEPAVFQKPVLFGPRYQKYREAFELIDAGGGLSVSDQQVMKATLQKFAVHPELIRHMGEKAGQYVRSKGGATQQVIHYIQENRLLTRP